MDRQVTTTRGIDRELMLEILAVAGITLLIAAPMRVALLDVIPPGLAFDEAVEGVDAANMLRDHQWPAFLPSNNGREPLFAYVVAAVFAVMGPGVLSLRLAAALLGILTVPAAYLCARELFDRPTAVFTALVLALSGWHIHLSRLALRPVALPLFEALALFFLWRALRTGRAWAWIACGLSLGLSFYTYIPARLLPFIGLAAVAFWLLARRSDIRRLWRRTLVVTLGVALVAAVVSIPLGTYFLRHPADFMGRAEQVSIATSIRAGADVGQALTDNALKTAGMFFVEGDSNPRHNLPGRPVFEAPVAALTLLGLLVCLRSIRRPAYAVLVCWLFVMLFPAVLSDSPPHFLRACGLLPGLFMVSGLGFSTLWRWSRALWRPEQALSRYRLASAGLGLGLVVALSVNLVASVQDVFTLWPAHPLTNPGFDVPKKAAGEYLERFPSDKPTYVGPLEVDDQVIKFLQPDLDVRSFGWSSLPLPPEGQGARYMVVGSDPGVIRRLERYLPSGRIVDEARNASGPLYSVYEVEASEITLPPSAESANRGASLGGEVEWLGYELRSTPRVGDELALSLAWRCLRKPSADYQVFVHLLGPDGHSWVVKDAEPGEGNQPTSQWAAGEVVLDYWNITLPAYAVPGEYRLVLGMLEWTTGQRLPVADREGRPMGTEIIAGTFQVADIVDVPEVALVPAERELDRVFASAQGHSVSLRGVTLESDQVVVGAPVAVTLFWQALDAVAGNLEVRLILTDPDGKVQTEWQGKPVGGLYPIDRWRPGRVVADRWVVVVPPAVVPGTYALSIGLSSEVGGDRLALTAGGEQLVEIGRLVVKDRQRQMTPPAVDHPVGLKLGNSIRLLGYDVSPTTVRPGDAIKLRLYWECLGPVGESYTVFTHLLDAGEKIWAQEDSIPGRGALPTSGWVTGEFVEDEYALVVTPGAPAGDCVIEVGMYLARSGQRLPITTDDGEIVGDRVLLGKIGVETP